MLKETEKHHSGVELNMLSCFRPAADTCIIDRKLFAGQSCCSVSPGPERSGLCMCSLSGELS